MRNEPQSEPFVGQARLLYGGRGTEEAEEGDAEEGDVHDFMLFFVELM